MWLSEEPALPALVQWPAGKTSNALVVHSISEQEGLAKGYPSQWRLAPVLCFASEVAGHQASVVTVSRRHIGFARSFQGDVGRPQIVEADGQFLDALLSDEGFQLTRWLVFQTVGGGGFDDSQGVVLIHAMGDSGETLGDYLGGRLSLT